MTASNQETALEFLADADANLKCAIDMIETALKTGGKQSFYQSVDLFEQGLQFLPKGLS